MRIGIMSDSHGDHIAIEEAVKLAGKVGLWLHAGDCREDARYLQLIAQTKVVGVNGNCDWYGADAEDEALIEAEGHRIFLTHGHLYDVRQGTGLLAKTASANHADIAVYGHTHVADIVPGALYILNPGSVSRPRDEARPSFILMDLMENNLPEIKLIRIQK